MIIVSRIRNAVALAALLGLLLPQAASAQETPANREAGIWIAGPDGRLRSVAPVPGTLRATASSPASPRSPAVRVVFEVEHVARSATGAISGSELAVARIAGALAAFGVSSADIETQPAFIQPRLERRLLAASWEKRRITHYEAGHLVTVTIRDPGRVGLLIDRAVGAGATRVIAMERS